MFLQILKVLAENAVAIRTKAMKCLTSVVEADPGVLARVSTVVDFTVLSQFMAAV